MLTPSKIFFIINLGFILFIGLRSFNNCAFLPVFKNTDVAFYNDRNLDFKGWVCEEADVDYKSRRLTVCAGSRVLITTNLYPEYEYGDFLQISGLVQKPEEFKGFDYERYLARYDIYSVMYYPKITRVNGELNFGQKIYEQLLKIKQGIKLVIDKSLPEPEAGLADALLLGYRRTILKENSDIFARVGLSHLIAISGSHITIMSAMVLNAALFVGLRRRAALKIVFAFLVIYPLVTGLSASAVRSAIMGGLVFLALYYGRLSSIIRALVFSAALMLMFNTRLLRSDIGFQLSFAAVLGIIYIYPLFSPLTQKIKKKFSGLLGKITSSLWEIFSLTLACQLAVLPIMIHNFKQFSIISFVANPAVIWIFPFLLAALIIPIIPALIFPSLGPWLFAPAYLMLKFIFVASHFFAAPSWAAISFN
ncbi:MAG: ComEC/Rec2 family competence protein [Candidatus Falkowbacteria bacterium]|nr:MAG: ComEC/Rec2 family competence protein [Candidatus Falkowbacteria bacterium]